MEEHIVKLLSVEQVTHDVKRFKVEKPAGYKFIPGQATEIAINQAEWKKEKRPFTFTSLNEWDHLEFTIKIYPDRKGVTNQLNQLKAGDEIILHDVWGAIQYKGKGVFIAGGAGITPFIAILRQLAHDGQAKGNTLLFSNKTSKDIILKDELKTILGDQFINTLTNEIIPGYDHHIIDEEYIRQKVKDMSQHFYICGPDKMVNAVQQILQKMGGKDTIVTVEM